MKLKIKNRIFDNLSYKIVSLLIALILWITILGRRDFTVTRSFEVDFQVNSSQVLVMQSSERIKVKVTGPRTALRRFMDTEAAQVIVVDLAGRDPGSYDVEIPNNKIDLPFGVKLLSISPNHIRVTLGKKD